MGDRTYAMFTLGGHIETVAELEELTNAIVCEGVLSMVEQDYMRDEDTVNTFIRHCVENNIPLSFDANEVNYGTFDEIEGSVSETPGLGAYFSWESGGSYEAGQKTIMPDGTELTAYGKDAAIPVSELVKARESDDPLAAIDKLIADARKAEGNDLPPFTVSPAVAAYLKIFADKVA